MLKITVAMLIGCVALAACGRSPERRSEPTPNSPVLMTSNSHATLLHIDMSIDHLMSAPILPENRARAIELGNDFCDLRQRGVNLGIFPALRPLDASNSDPTPSERHCPALRRARAGLSS